MQSKGILDLPFKTELGGPNTRRFASGFGGANTFTRGQTVLWQGNCGGFGRDLEKNFWGHSRVGEDQGSFNSAVVQNGLQEKAVLRGRARLGVRKATDSSIVRLPHWERGGSSISERYLFSGEQGTASRCKWLFRGFGLLEGRRYISGEWREEEMTGGEAGLGLSRKDG